MLCREGCTREKNGEEHRRRGRVQAGQESRYSPWWEGGWRGGGEEQEWAQERGVGGMGLGLEGAGMTRDFGGNGKLGSVGVDSRGGKAAGERLQEE